MKADSRLDGVDSGCCTSCLRHGFAPLAPEASNNNDNKRKTLSEPMFNKYTKSDKEKKLIKKDSFL